MIDRRSGRIAATRHWSDNASTRIDSGTGKGAKITAAEMRVLNLVTGAKTNKEIAAMLGISPATVKRHLESILRKLQLKNRVEAAIYGLTIDGCPEPRVPDCPLISWRKNRATSD